MLILLTLLGCNPDAIDQSEPTDPAPRNRIETQVSSHAPPLRPTPRSASEPRQELIVQQCHDGRNSGRGFVGAPSPKAAPRARYRRPTTAPAPTPPMNPVPQAVGVVAEEAPIPRAAPPAMDAVAEEAPIPRAAPRTAPEDAPPPVARPRGDKDAEREPADPASGHGRITMLQGEEDRQSWFDWGATVHLSNDDSMSLASAQRVLWSVMNGRRPSPSEIRPHELLNYFSFDTAAVPEGQLFSVLGAAERSDDTLSLALAVQGGTLPRQPLDLTLVVDRSGSMWAEGRMDYTKRGLNQLVDQLERGDRVDVVMFDDYVCSPVQNFVVGRDDPAILTQAVQRIEPRGGTNLDAGLREAYWIQTQREAQETHGRNRRVMLITDAQLNKGRVNPHLVSEIGQHLEDNDIRLSAVGVGRDFRDDVLDLLTEKGKGAYVYLGSEAVVDRVFGPGFASLTQTIAHDVRFSLDLPPSLAMARFYGEEASTDAADIQPIHYYAGTSQVFLQDLQIREGDIDPNDPIVMHLAWRDATTGEPDALELHTTLGALLDGDRSNLHKAQALMAWTDWLQQWVGQQAPCGSELDAFAAVRDRVGDDAEIAFLTGLTEAVCGPTLSTTNRVAYKVRVDSDVPIRVVDLACGNDSWIQRLSSADTIARFEEARPGACTLTLLGQVANQAAVDVPSTGGDVRCTLRAGRMSCT